MLRKGGGVAFQFWSFPIKQLEFLSSLAKHAPLKLLGWIAMSEGLNITLKELAGIDLSNALGFGINYGQLIDAFASLPTDRKKAMYHAKQAFKSGGGIFPYGFGPTVNLMTDLGKALVGTTDLQTFLASDVYPAMVSRGIQGVQALTGEKTPEGKYIVKSMQTGRPAYEETAADIAKRTFIGRPVAETKEMETRTRERLQMSLYNSIQKEISDLLVQGKKQEANELAKKYRMKISKTSIEAAKERATKVPSKRIKKSKARTPFQEYLEQ
jgi:hypothetical protein